MGHEVRTHTRRTASGKTVTVRQHNRQDDGVAPANAPLADEDQDKRDRFERRHQRERQAQEKRALREQHDREKGDLQQRQGGKPARSGGQRRPARLPGEKRKRKSRAPARAKRHAKKAKRLFRKHKAKALGYGLLALGEIAVHGAGKGSRKLHGRRK